ncbi:Phosphotransferase enzyme family protein [Corynebacterium felinum]|nr:Phosphotransferase enzyme family protein [Corynebacterium felinum]
MRVREVLFSLPSVVRAWPQLKTNSVVFEQIIDGQLRAGAIDADGVVRLVPFGCDEALPELAPHEGLVVHRLNKRAVVVNRAAGVVVKHVRKGVGPDYSALAKAAGFRAASVVRSAASVVEYELLPGDTLCALGDASVPGWERFVELWPKFARGAGVGLSSHDAGDELGVLRHWLNQVEHFGMLDAHSCQRLARSVDALAGELLKPADPCVVLHRDLHDKQLLWDGSQLSVLDLDTVAFGEAALDVGNVLAHVELRGFQKVYSDSVQARISQAVRELADSLVISPSRLQAYTQAARLRLCCVYAFRPSAQPFINQWISHSVKE